MYISFPLIFIAKFLLRHKHLFVLSPYGMLFISVSNAYYILSFLDYVDCWYFVLLINQIKNSMCNSTANFISDTVNSFVDSNLRGFGKKKNIFVCPVL